VNVTAGGARRRLDDWMTRIESAHPRSIDMGLDRVGAVADRTSLRPFPAACLTVAGTNGKGSCALILERLLTAHGRRVGTYTSPHLVRYNERVRLAGREADDDALCAAFEAVEDARGDIPLTYFEYGTLAALYAFREADVDTVVLEVGMGGRLDAVTLLDADVALITSIGLDHGDWLGDTREAIGREKAGILRAGRPAVCADRDPPASVAATAAELGAPLYRIGRDFDLEAGSDAWCWRDWRGWHLTLAPVPGLLPDNLAAALAGLTLHDALPETATLERALDGFSVPGRRQVVPGTVPIVLDVAHNVEAAAVLADWLAARPIPGRTHLVLGMLESKPAAAVVDALAPRIGEIFAAGLPGVGRGLSGAALAARLPYPATVHDDVASALAAARAFAGSGDRILVCGSFYTVGAAMAALET
jgi:dihydrofolate synthase/folylpolyglutamate synthase